MDKKWETSGIDEANFHSSRKERYELGGIGENKIKKSFFQRNPSFKIIIIDLIFIVIISGVIVPFIFNREGKSSIDNYRLTMRAFEYDDQVMVTLTILETGGERNNGVADGVFYLASDSISSSHSDILPDSGEERVLKSSLPFNKEKYAFCDISINGQTKTIKKKIK